MQFTTSPDASYAHKCALTLYACLALYSCRTLANSICAQMSLGYTSVLFSPPFVVVPTLTARIHTRKCAHVQFMRSAPCSRLFCLPTRLASLTQPSVRIKSFVKWPPRVAICTLCTQCVCVFVCGDRVRHAEQPNTPCTQKSDNWKIVCAVVLLLGDTPEAATTTTATYP